MKPDAGYSSNTRYERNKRYKLYERYKLDIVCNTKGSF